MDPGSPLRLQVAAASYAGTHVRLELRGDGLALDAHVPPATAPRVGELLGVTLPRDDLWRLPASDQQGQPQGETARAPAAPGTPG
jgi:hypothetical protein